MLYALCYIKTTFTPVTDFSKRQAHLTSRLRLPQQLIVKFYEYVSTNGPQKGNP